jgi:acetate kinase
LAGAMMRSKKGSFNILVFNCGSSSLKYRIVKMPQEEEIVAGEAQGVGIKTLGGAFVEHIVLGQKRRIKAQMPDQASAFNVVMDLLAQDAAADPGVKFDVCGHRYVHPGNFFSKTTLIGKSELKKLKATFSLAPIHNPVSYSLIELFFKTFSNVPQYAVFDTLFHSDIPAEFYTYALPAGLIKKYGLRKIGFHGISHEYVVNEACAYLKRDIKNQKIISCHIGSGGASICAVKDGKSLNTTMGYSPLEGLMMNTRSGDIDLGVMLYLMFKNNLSVKEIEKVLNRKSGVLGLYRDSSDLRDVAKNIGSNPRAKTVFSMYISRIRKYISFYEVILKGADIVVFTDSLGVEMPLLRSKICDGFDVFGIKADDKKNLDYQGGISDISGPGSQARIMIIPTNEELMIAREVYKAVR